MTTMRIRDVSLFVKVVGRDYPLLLMHGGPSADHTTMLPFRRCADRFTLVFYDHRCNGRSVGAPVSSMTWENLTADAEALRQRLGFRQWAVLGHSFGGHVALEYALRYPDRVSHLVPLDTGGDSHWSQQHATDLLASRGYSPRRWSWSGAGSTASSRPRSASASSCGSGTHTATTQPVAAGARTPGSCSTRLNAAAAPVGGFEPGRSAQAYCRTVVKP
jgi:pimeloyl-ACP methyl ester carboxylesterase